MLITKKQGFLVALLTVALSFSAVPAMAQQTSGTISGVVQDSQNAVVPGAKVVLINQAQGATVRELASGSDGSFVFTPVPPGAYTVSVEASGFKKYIWQDIEVNAQGRVGLPPIVLEIGTVGESITVEGSTVALQTVSAERSGVINTSQMVDLAVSGRSYMDLMKTIPGVAADSQSVNGGRSDQNSYSVDGVSAIDTGCNCMWYSVNTDTLAEFKVLTNGQQAEFGRAASANVTVVTKSGSRDFHGGAYWFLRNESLNANKWDNNYYGNVRPMYRYRTQGFTLGGPVYLPGKFNSDKEKLFFFANMEWLRPKTPDSLTNLLVPTAAELTGDFSQSREANGAAVVVRDPSTGLAFPGNRIPGDRINTYGLQLLKLFPAPTRQGADPTFNYQYTFPSKSPSDNETYRIDYNIAANWKFYFRFVRNHTDSFGSGGLNASNNVGLSPFNMQIGAIMGMGNLTTIISPTLTNELVYGNTRGFLPNVVPKDSKYLRANSGVTLPLLYPNADPTGIVPDLSFGTQYVDPQQWPSIDFNGLPYDNENPVVNWTDNLAKVFPAHTVKAGFFMEIARKRQTATAPNNGKIYFDRDAGNPGDTNWAYANALIGNFKAYDQASAILKGYYYYRNIEWYIQDNWKVLPNLTLDYGMRFSLIDPMYEEKNQISSFDPAEFKIAQQVKLFQPAIDPNTGAAAAKNPITGAIVSRVFMGSIVPGSGNVNNGMMVAGQGYPRGLIESRGVHYGPRFGLAWSPEGAGGKSVVRAGGGVFYERIEGNMIFNQILYPPQLRIPRIYYGNLSNIASAAQTDFPVTAAGVSREGKLPTIYNYSVGVQRELPGKLLLDLSYVGSLSRHLTSRRPFNEPAFGSAWLPQNQDPIVTPKYDGTTTLPVDFTRPYVGYAGYGTASGGNHPGGGGFITDFGASSNYNALQVSVNRRMSEGLQVGLAYTWSKALGTQSAINEAQHPTDNRKANYGPLTFDRRQNFVLNYIYRLPSLIGKGGGAANSVGRALLGGWEISGITTFMSGAPFNISYGVLNTPGAALNRMITGSEPQAPRVVMSGNPNLPKGTQTEYRYVDTGVFHPAAKGSQGMDSGRGVITGPGINNWDLSLFKRIPLGKDEQRYIQLRMEMYNAFNHTQFGSFNSTLTFDAAGNIANLPSAGNRFGFGALGSSSDWSVAGVRNARIIQLAAKFYF